MRFSLRTSKPACVAAALLLTAGAPARAELGTIEQAYESDSTTLSVPDRVGTSLTLPGCTRTCPGSVRLTDATRFLIAGRPVTLVQLRAHLQKARVDVTVFYDPKTLDANRIVSY